MLQSNIIVRGVLFVVGLVVLLVIMKSWNKDETHSEYTLNGGQALTEIERKEMGIEADTPEDTVATLVSQVKNLRDNIGTLSDENSQLQRENQKLTNMEGSMERRLETKLKKSQEAIERKGDQALEDQDRKLQRLFARSQADTNKGGIGFPYGNEPNGQRIGDTYWVAPLEGQYRH